jgi:hypothetical protein
MCCNYVGRLGTMTINFNDKSNYMRETYFGILFRNLTAEAEVNCRKYGHVSTRVFHE